MTQTELIRANIIADTMFAVRFFFSSQEGKKFIRCGYHEQITGLLDEVFAGKYNRVIINLPPRYSKTEILKRFVQKGLGINPSSKYIMLSYSANLAYDNSEAIKDAVSSEWYQRIFPWVRVKQDSSAKQKWYTTAGGGMYAAPADGQVTGFGAGNVDTDKVDINGFLYGDDPDAPQADKDIVLETGCDTSWGGAIIIDDPLKPLDAESPVKREKVNMQFENTIRSRVNDRSTPIIIIMQRLHKDDLCGYLMKLEPDKWKVLSLPALSVDSDGREVALNPHKHTVEELHALRAANRFTFDTQYQQDPHSINEKLWLFAFNREKHTRKGLEYDPRAPMVMTWDFNRNPMTCTLFQHVSGQVRGIDCIRIENATTRMVCEEIHKRYPNVKLWMVTGDCAGKNATTVSLLNNYDIVKAYFRLGNAQMQYSGSNPRLADSRYFMNSLFEQYDIVFDEDKCAPAIFDFENVMADEENRPLKNSRENAAQQADFLDNVRYYFHRYFNELRPKY